MHRRMRSRVEGRSILGREKYQKEISFNMEMLLLLRHGDRVRETRKKEEKRSYIQLLCVSGEPNKPATAISGTVVLYVGVKCAVLLHRKLIEEVGPMSMSR